MSEENKIGRREAIKEIAAGVGAVSSLPVLNNISRAEGHSHHVAAPLVTEAGAGTALIKAYPAGN